MSQVYRAHSPAQVIGEAVVIAAALLAAVEAAPVPSTTPSRGIFKAEDAVRRKPWTTLAVIAFAALAGAVVFGGGGESRDHTLPVNAALSSAASVVEPAIEGAAGAAPAPERVTEADPAPSSESQRATDATTGQSTSTSKDWRKASRERASRNDRRNVLSTPTLPKRQRLRRRLRSLKLGMPQLQQRTRIVTSSSQTMSSCPITTNFVAFDEQQEVALGAFAV